MKNNITLIPESFFVMLAGVLITLTLVVTLLGCGSASDGDSAAPAANVDSQGVEESGPLNSIAVAKVSDLPECSEANDTQLGYVKAEDLFYVCENASWETIAIKDGKDGSDGVTTIQEIEATNKKNQWVDPITGLSWLLGGGGDYSQAVAACSGDYRLPTWAEASTAISHGVRAVAASVPTSTQNFWLLNESGYYYATETAGAPNKFNVAASAGYNIFCVK